MERCCLLDEPSQQDRPVDVVILTWLEGHRDRPIDHVESAVTSNLAPVPTQFLSESVAIGIDIR